MKLRGYRAFKSNSYYIPVNIHIPQFNISKPITFLMDTGAEITIINPFDSTFNLNIYSKISTQNIVKSEGIGGILVDNIPLNNCVVYYFYLDKYSVH
jgi:hypothetical protein